MSAREREMAELLAGTHREERLSAVIANISPDASAMLDLGCGIGALTTRLARRFPSALIIGVDRSKYLLRKSQGIRNASMVLGDIPTLPFRDGFFDLAVAIQVLHEIFHFKGPGALSRTVQNVFGLLKEDGEFIILDHVNPGDASISLELSEELQMKLLEFQSKFKPRRITYCDLGKGRIRTSMRDFYDSITKIWALNSELEEEEMSETHTPFTCQEYVNLVQKAGFKVTHTASLTPIDRHIEHYSVTMASMVRLPSRHILLCAKKMAIENARA